MHAIDPLLQPFTLKGVELRNRVVSTSHEPAYTEDGMPKDRYRLYHLEKARGGVGLTMIGGSAVVSPDSPPAFGNMLLYKDEIVPWLRRLTDDCHEAGAAVMCQVTHLGRRTSNFTGDWLPLVYPSGLREAQHRSFPKAAEPWDVDRIVRDFADAAARCEAAGLDGIEIESYSHLFDAWVSPATNQRDDAFGGSLENRLAFPLRVLDAVRARSVPTSSSACAWRWTSACPAGSASTTPSTSCGATASTASTSSRSSRAASTPTPGSPPRSRRWARRPRRSWSSPGRCAAPSTSPSCTPPASATSPPPATRSATACSTWSG